MEWDQGTIYVGFADGAQCNWAFLEAHTDYQIVDFWHATRYLADVAQGVFPDCEANRSNWLENYCHHFKHYPDAGAGILDELKGKRSIKSVLY